MLENQPFKNLISFTSKSLLISAVIYLLIVAVISTGMYFWGYKNGVKNGQVQATEEAQAKISQAPIGQADQNEVLRISGQISSRSDLAASPQFITVSVVNLNRNPLAQPTPAERKIIIDQNTKIFKKVRKPADQIAKERYQYAEAIKKNPNAPAPSSTIDSVIGFKDLRAGQTVKVFGSNDIRNQAEFTAVEIDIFE